MSDDVKIIIFMIAVVSFFTGVGFVFGQAIGEITCREQAIQHHAAEFVIDPVTGTVSFVWKDKP